MKTPKNFDCVQMMRDIRNQIDTDISNMSAQQILDYIRGEKKRHTKTLNRTKLTSN